MRLLTTVAAAALLVSFGAYAQDNAVKPCIPGQQASRATENNNSQLASQAGDRKEGEAAQLASKAGGNESAQLASKAGEGGNAPQLAAASVCE